MQPRRLNLSAIQVMASVLAAVTGALAASYLGVAGTIIGAAVFSFASTVGAAVYRHALGRATDRLRSTAGLPPPRDRAHGQRASRHPLRAPADPAGAAARLYRLRDENAAAQPPGLRGEPGHAGTAGMDPRRAVAMLEGLRAASMLGTDGAADAGRADQPGHGAPGNGPAGGGGHRWLALTSAVVATFLITMAVITGIELAVGRPLDSIIWHRHGTGTTVGTVVNGPAAPPHRTPHPTQTGYNSRPPATPAPHASRLPSHTRTPPAPPQPTAPSPSPSPSGSPLPTPSTSQTVTTPSAPASP